MNPNLRKLRHFDPNAKLVSHKLMDIGYSLYPKFYYRYYYDARISNRCREDWGHFLNQPDAAGAFYMAFMDPDTHQPEDIEFCMGIDIDKNCGEMIPLNHPMTFMFAYVVGYDDDLDKFETVDGIWKITPNSSFKIIFYSLRYGFMIKMPITAVFLLAQDRVDIFDPVDENEELYMDWVYYRTIINSAWQAYKNIPLNRGKIVDLTHWGMEFCVIIARERIRQIVYKLIRNEIREDAAIARYIEEVALMTSEVFDFDHCTTLHNPYFIFTPYYISEKYRRYYSRIWGHGEGKKLENRKLPEEVKLEWLRRVDSIPHGERNYLMVRLSELNLDNPLRENEIPEYMTYPLLRGFFDDPRSVTLRVWNLPDSSLWFPYLLRLKLAKFDWPAYHLFEERMDDLTMRGKRRYFPFRMPSGVHSHQILYGGDQRGGLNFFYGLKGVKRVELLDQSGNTGVIVRILYENEGYKGPGEPRDPSQTVPFSSFSLGGTPFSPLVPPFLFDDPNFSEGGRERDEGGAWDLAIYTSYRMFSLHYFYMLFHSTERDPFYVYIREWPGEKNRRGVVGRAPPPVGSSSIVAAVPIHQAYRFVMNQVSVDTGLNEDDLRRIIGQMAYLRNVRKLNIDFQWTQMFSFHGILYGKTGKGFHSPFIYGKRVYTFNGYFHEPPEGYKAFNAYLGDQNVSVDMLIELAKLLREAREDGLEFFSDDPFVRAIAFNRIPDIEIFRRIIADYLEECDAIDFEEYCFILGIEYEGEEEEWEEDEYYDEGEEEDEEARDFRNMTMGDFIDKYDPEH